MQGAKARDEAPALTTGSGSVPLRQVAGPTIRGQSPRGFARANTSRSRWQCPTCGSERIQVRLPVWFTEYADGTLIQTNLDEEADPQAWYCEACFECESGEPSLVEVDSPTLPPEDSAIG